jgi:hypothetical protein
MSALDLKLINEFRSVPAFYNRKCERFKAKAFVERAWQNIAKKLGYKVNNVKDRMYQLRNRYNLEKRKLQSMREDGILNPKPVWPLFHNLNFLSGHIRQRKSYKMMRPIKHREGFRGFTREEGRYGIIRRPHSIEQNVEMEIKKESNDNNEQEFENDNDMVNPGSFLEDPINANDVQQQTLSKTSQTLKNINILKQSLLEDDCTDTLDQRKPVRIHHASHKFEAFGSFVNASLQDLPQHKALVMIDRFTSEIVRALTTNQTASTSSSTMDVCDI